jgi:hypothetical protein
VDGLDTPEADRTSRPGSPLTTWCAHHVHLKRLRFASSSGYAELVKRSRRFSQSNLELAKHDLPILWCRVREIFERLEKNEDFASIAADVSRLTGVTPGQVAIYVQAVVNSQPAAE